MGYSNINKLPPHPEAKTCWTWAEESLRLAETMPDGRPWPKISIVTPCLNSLALLKQTVYSILGSHYPNLEYIIVDGGSNDGTDEFIEGIKKNLHWWCSEKDKGPYQAINKGFAHATGEIMAWLNAGDIYFPWTLGEIARIFTQFPDIDWMVGIPAVAQEGAIRHVESWRPYPRQFIQTGFYYGSGLWIQQESCFWRRRLWEKACPLREDLRLACDFELWIRFANFVELVSAKVLLAAYVIHENQRGRVGYKEYIEEADKVIDGFPKEKRLLRKRLFREVSIFKKVKGVIGIRGLARRILNIDRYKGYVLKWDYENKRYSLMRKSYF